MLSDRKKRIRQTSLCFTISNAANFSSAKYSLALFFLISQEMFPGVRHICFILILIQCKHLFSRNFHEFINLWKVSRNLARGCDTMACSAVRYSKINIDGALSLILPLETSTTCDICCLLSFGCLPISSAYFLCFDFDSNQWKFARLVTWPTKYLLIGQ